MISFCLFRFTGILAYISQVMVNYLVPQYLSLDFSLVMCLLLGENMARLQPVAFCLNDWRSIRAFIAYLRALEQ